MTRNLRLTPEQYAARKGRLDRSISLGAKPKPERSTSTRGNVKTTVDNITFHSRREAERYKVLTLLEAAREIDNLKCQVRYPLQVEGKHICDYIADFVYFNKDGGIVVEDSKGHREPIYKLKAKLMQAIYGITILET